jgi:hypothetical protein
VKKPSAEQQRAKKFQVQKLNEKWTKSMKIGL